MELAYQSHPPNLPTNCMMYGQQPWYQNYEPNPSYKPYPRSSYQRPSPIVAVPAPRRRGYPNTRAAEERRRALAERRARRAQWLPDEVDEEEEEEEEDWGYGNYAQPQPSPWEVKQRMQEEQARRQQEEALRRQEDQWRQQVLMQERMEEEQAKQRMWAEQRQQALRQEEEARQRAAAQEKAAPRRRSRSRGRPLSREREEEQLKAPQAPLKEAAMAEPAEPMAEEPTAPMAKPTEPTAEPAEPMAVEPQAQPESTSQTPKPRPSIEEQEKAARRIQQQYRTHAAKRTLDQVASDFEKLKNSFVYPRSIDFQRPGMPGEQVNVPANRAPSEFDKEPEEGEGVPMNVDGEEGKLGYSSRNYPLHSYVDALDKLLMRLDRVESAGNPDIRAKRRAIVKDIEKEASKLERYWKQAWADYPKNEPVQQSEAPAPVASESNMDTSVPNFG